MHDTILLNKISDAIRETCRSNNIKKINNITVVVSNKSHVSENNLYEHLKYVNEDLIGEWTKINVNKEDIQDQMAILHSIQGETT
jgi:Zn finger protein HypA/HybF involved in hydrogenase expression